MWAANPCDRVTVSVTRDYEFIPREFEIATNVHVPVGGYTYQNVAGLVFNRDAAPDVGERLLPAGVVLRRDQEDARAGIGAGGADAAVRARAQRVAQLDRPAWGRFTTTVVTQRTTYTTTPRMFLSAPTQYASSSRTFSTNARFRWEYRPGREMFVVYSDGRDTTAPGFPVLADRAFIVKVNRLIRL
jgi:hypothetical protein